MRKTLIALSIACLLGTSAPILSASPVKPPLALAKTFKQSVDVSQYWVSEKMDGARAYWDGEQLLSRSGLVFYAPEWFTQGFPDYPLDGELWMGRGRFQDLMHVVRDRIPDDAGWRQVSYWVFDLPSDTGDFEDRQHQLALLKPQVDAEYLRWVEHRRVADHADLQIALQEVIAAGGEGLMLQKRDLAYRSGRHAGLLKLKPFADSEAIVVDYVPGKGKYSGMVGALVVEDGQGRSFRLGSGLSDAQRVHPPELGSQVSYRYQGRTGSGLPRFARFLRVRPEE